MTEKKKKTSLWKRILKWTVAIFLTLFVLLLASPYLFKDKIKTLILNSINKNLNATVTFEELNLSFIRSFPMADVSLDQVNVINKAPFEGDTLFYGKELHLKMKITELFKGKNEPMNIQSFSINNGQVNVFFNEQSDANYDIALKKETQESTNEQPSFLSLDIQQYSVENLNFTYFDASSQIELLVNNIQHSGSGILKGNLLDLATKTQANVSLKMNTVSYMNQIHVSADALLGIDLAQSKYTFKENKALINQLPLEFEGFIQLVGDNSDQLYELSFRTPTSSFKNLLGIVPEQYSGNIQRVQTEGNFDLNGRVHGLLSENSIPKFDIQLNSKNAMFQYPELPKSVRNIHLDSKISNATGNLNDTYVQINTLSFAIDQDVFETKAQISNLIENPKMQLQAKGTVNLKNISQAYPIPLEHELSGILKANLNTSFDMESVEKRQYQNIQNSGSLALSNFVYTGKDAAHPFSIENAAVVFNAKAIQLNELKAATGNSDLFVKGSLHNFYGFLFNKEVLKGDFTLNSNQLHVSDFMTESTPSASKETTPSVLKIPAFLDCSFQASANKVMYDGIEFSKASGTLKVKDETVVLEDLRMNAFTGLIKLDGNVSTKDSVANFAMKLRLEDLDIKQSFSQLNTLNKIAPIANVVGGKMNSDVQMDGKLNESMTPNLKTISGNLLGQLLNTQLNASNSKILSAVGSELSFIDIKKLNLEKIKTYIAFKDGRVVVKPFQMNYEDIGIEVGGSHGFDQSMNYDLTFQVPAKYLGKEVNDLIAKLSAKDQQSLQSVPIKATLTGSFTNPTFKTDVKNATTQLIQNLVQQQKDNLVEKGKDKLLNLLGKDKDSTKSKNNGLLNNLLKKKKKN